MTGRCTRGVASGLLNDGIVLAISCKTLFMLWKGRQESTNVDDRRGISGGGLAVGGGIIGVIFILAKFLLGGGDASDLE